ncbi:MAG: YggS family pyridoxal phosphate-dependent enzyme [Fibromonadales bacterium]|nr:YggS family pyridoxal phosphate-dependent enzyme [Fibromonadales bacterium]
MLINKQVILDRIAKACGLAGRAATSVRLIWVSKTQPFSEVEKAIALGARDFGENRVQEALEKFLPCREGIACRIIGPVQKNKLRKAAQVAQAIDSIADLESVLKLEALCKEAGKNLEILFQVNTSEEATKSGLSMQDAFDFIINLPEPARLVYKGLMTIGKNTGNPEDSRACFAFLRNLRDRIYNSQPKFAHFTELSMGMTDDLEIAIAEGATMVRVGTALFGKRITILPLSIS